MYTMLPASEYINSPRLELDVNELQIVPTDGVLHLAPSIDNDGMFISPNLE
jgi:hypothetical protein